MLFERFTLLFLFSNIAASLATPNDSKSQTGSKEEEKQKDPFGTFLSNISEKEQQKFREIATNVNQPKKDMMLKMDQWAKKQGEDFQIAYNKAKKESEELQKMVGEKIKTSNLTEGAKKALTKIEELSRRDDISIFEEMTQKNAIINKLTDAESREISDFMSKLTQ